MSASLLVGEKGVVEVSAELVDRAWRTCKYSTERCNRALHTNVLPDVFIQLRHALPYIHLPVAARATAADLAILSPLRHRHGARWRWSGVNGH